MNSRHGGITARIAKRAIAQAAGLAFVACGDSTGPDTDFDPVTTASIVADLLDASRQNPAIQSLTVLGPKIELPSVGTPPTPTPGAVSAVGIPMLGPGLGRRLIFNATTEAYEFAEDDGDTPANAVRFVQYTVDMAEDRVTVPLAPIGNVDVVDKSAGGMDSIVVRAVVDGESLIDYEATGAGNIVFTTFEHNIAGFIATTDGPIDMNLEQRISVSEGVALDYRLERNQTVISILLDFDAQTFTATTTMTVTSGGTVLSMTTSGTPQSIEGTVRSNNTEVARIGGTAATPVFTDTNGDPVLGEKLTALNDLFAAPDRLFAIIDAALAPAYWAFGLKLIFQD